MARARHASTPGWAVNAAPSRPAAAQRCSIGTRTTKNTARAACLAPWQRTFLARLENVKLPGATACETGRVSQRRVRANTVRTTPSFHLCPPRRLAARGAVARGSVRLGASRLAVRPGSGLGAWLFFVRRSVGGGRAAASSSPPGRWVLPPRMPGAAAVVELVVAGGAWGLSALPPRRHGRGRLLSPRVCVFGG